MNEDFEQSVKEHRQKIKAGDIWAEDMPREYGYCEYHITAVGETKLLAYEHPYPHEKNTVESTLYVDDILKFKLIRRVK